MEEEQISRIETARILGVSTRTVNRYVARKYLECTYARLPQGGWAPRFSRQEVEGLARRRAESLVPKGVCS